jgi:hypothetical protein
MNAIAGVFRAYEANPSGFRHCWGLPVLPHVPFSDITSSMPFMIDIQSHKWSASAAFIAALGFELEVPDPAERREGFPSWSWCGWKTPIGVFPWDPTGFSDQHFSPECLNIDDRVDVKLEQIDGKVISWDAYSRLDQIARQAQLSRYIHVTAPMTAITLKHCNVGIEVRSQRSRRLCFTMRVQTFQKVPQAGLLVHVLPTSSTDNTPRDRLPVVLVVAQVDGAWERLGVHHFHIQGYENLVKELRTIRLG